MFAPNVEKLLGRLAPSDLVLDVGGWACPFNRAQWVLDAQPFETRGFYRTFGGAPYQGPEQEWFRADGWVQRDMCDRSPWPFVDKQFDFVICSHTLEDIRDPLWVCSEMIRVGKRGYIEVPSREWESCRGIESPRMVGLSHHRWLIDIEGNHLRFQQKYHTIHSHWRFSLPQSHLRRLSAERTVQWLWWESDFSSSEIVLHGPGSIEAELERFVQQVRPYPDWRLKVDRALRRVTDLACKVGRRLVVPATSG
jgi:hypothetical protein